MSRPLVYLLHSGQMFGTERMALATLAALGPRTRGIVLAPPGPVYAAAAEAGIDSHACTCRWAMAWALARILWRDRRTAVLATAAWQSVAAALLQRLLGSAGTGGGAHLHLVHGGTEERLSYGRKRWLNRLPLTFVAVSGFVRDRLMAHGVPAGRIEVIHNFLHPSPRADGGLRVPPSGGHEGVRRVVMLTRLDRIKRVGLLFDALERQPALRQMQFDIHGSGEEQAALRERAARFPNVTLHGYSAGAAQQLAHADLLLHTCPEEPFGLALLEAFAAGVPVLVPNSGGAGAIVRDGVTGFHFTANDPVALGTMLSALQDAPAGRLQAVARKARATLDDEFDPVRQSLRYLALIDGSPRDGSACLAGGDGRAALRGTGASQ